jgi:hypothetical protein
MAKSAYFGTLQFVPLRESRSESGPRDRPVVAMKSVRAGTHGELPAPPLTALSSQLGESTLAWFDLSFGNRSLETPFESLTLAIDPER